MTLNTQKEQFSIAYVRAVIAAAGFNVTRCEVDDDSIDIGITARGPLGSIRSPKLDVQLKCTGEGELAADQLSFALKLKNYDDLRFNDYQVPRILVVVTVPKNVNDWLEHTHGHLAMRHCGYWLSLRGMAQYTGQADDPRITVHVPRTQPFTVEELRALMSAVGRGEKP